MRLFGGENVFSAVVVVLRGHTMGGGMPEMEMREYWSIGNKAAGSGARGGSEATREKSRVVARKFAKFHESSHRSGP